MERKKNMEVIVGKTAGFCYGVKRAVEGAKEELKKNETLYGLGEIVHNQEVIKELENLGMQFIEDIGEAKGRTIIRAHGIPKQIYEEAKEKQIEIMDYTCPKVLKIHQIAEEYTNKGYYIFLLGSKTHPENIGTLSYCGENKFVIEKEEDVIKALEAFEKSGIQKVLVISQTTYSLEKFYIIEEMIKNEIPRNIELVIKNTICQATEIRQKETEEMAKQVDCMIVIGGKNSSNTRKIYEIAKQYCKTILWIENETELVLDKIKPTDKVGIMAGASTPKESIEKVVKKLNVEFCDEKYKK